jgi:hypothetical protein
MLPLGEEQHMHPCTGRISTGMKGIEQNEDRQRRKEAFRYLSDTKPYHHRLNPCAYKTVVGIEVDGLKARASRRVQHQTWGVGESGEAGGEIVSGRAERSGTRTTHKDPLSEMCKRAGIFFTLG